MRPGCPGKAPPGSAHILLNRNGLRRSEKFFAAARISGQPFPLPDIYIGNYRGNFRRYQTYLVAESLRTILAICSPRDPQISFRIPSQLPLKQARWKAGLLLFGGCHAVAVPLCYAALP